MQVGSPGRRARGSVGVGGRRRSSPEESEGGKEIAPAGAAVRQSGRCGTMNLIARPWTEAIGAMAISGITGVRTGHAPCLMLCGSGQGKAAPSGARKAIMSSLRKRSPRRERSEEHTSELQSLMRISYAVFCLKKKNNINTNH